MEENIERLDATEEEKDILKLDKDELKKIFEQMSLSEIEDMIDMLNEVKNSD